MAKRIVWSVKASYELKEILSFWINKTGNKRYSEKLNREIRHTVKNIAAQIYIGRQADASEARALVCGNYLLFYRTNQKSIFVLTVFDSRRNPSDLNYEDLPE